MAGHPGCMLDQRECYFLRRRAVLAASMVGRWSMEVSQPQRSTVDGRAGINQLPGWSAEEGT